MPTINTTDTEDKPDVVAVASLLVPDDASKTAVTELREALDQAGFTVTHCDGFDGREAVAYDVIAPDHSEAKPEEADR